MLAGRRGEKNILQLINDFDRTHLKTFELQFHGVSVVADEQFHLKRAEHLANVDSPRLARRTIAEEKLQTIEFDQTVDELRKVKKTFGEHEVSRYQFLWCFAGFVLEKLTNVSVGELHRLDVQRILKKQRSSSLLGREIRYLSATETRVQSDGEISRKGIRVEETVEKEGGGRLEEKRARRRRRSEEKFRLEEDRNDQNQGQAGDENGQVPETIRGMEAKMFNELTDRHENCHLLEPMSRSEV